MIEIKFYGIGGQGVVTASKMLAQAILLEGKEAQSFPMFGIERMGTPVSAFLRIDQKPILIRCQIAQPDCLVVFDSSLLKNPETFKGLKPGGRLIANGRNIKAEGRGLNMIMAGAVIRILRIADLESLKKIIEEEMPDRAGINILAAEKGFKEAGSLKCFLKN